MRFFCDQDVWASTVHYLRSLGHGVTTASEAGMAQAADAQLLSHAQAEGRILVTRDRDFGSLTFTQSAGAGVIYLRIEPTQVAHVHDELQRVLGLYEQAGLTKPSS